LIIINRCLDIYNNKKESRVMKRALKVENSVIVNTVETLPTGVKVLTIDYCGDYTQIPKALLYEGKVYGRSGWNSDRNTVYFRSDIKLAFSIDK